MRRNRLLNIKPETISGEYAFSTNNANNLITPFDCLTCYSTDISVGGKIKISTTIPKITSNEDVNYITYLDTFHGQRLEVSPDVEEFIAKKAKLKDFAKKMVIQIPSLVLKDNSNARIIFNLDADSIKIECRIYLTNKTMGKLFDLNDEINKLIFEEANKRDNLDERLGILNLFDTKFFDTKNGIKL